MTRRLLIVSPHWPPVNAPDLQRVRMSLPYYREHGWEPVVLTVHPDDVAGVREPELLATVPADSHIETCRAWPLERARRFGLGSLGIRAWNALRRTGDRLLSRERFDLVFFSNTQFVTFTLGPYWRRRYGVPYVIDIQDPWRTDYYERPGAPRPPGGRKYLLARLIARLGEEPTYRRAAGFVSVSGRYCDDLSQRYPWFGNKPRAALGFGMSERDLAAARALPPSPHAWRPQPGEIHLLYTGAAGPIMPHALDFLFSSFRRFRDVQPAAASRFRFHFYGTSYVRPAEGHPRIQPVAAAHGVDDLVDEIPHRLGHLESLALQLQADALLLPGSSDLAYSPSKLYPYYLSGKPILGLVFAGSYLEALLHDLNCATIATIPAAAATAKPDRVLVRFFEDALAGFPPVSQPVRRNDLFRSRFLAERLTAQQCQLFDQVAASERHSGQA
ncbi:MAG TPA: glycosyltransferase [Opitutaceae bacterium]